MKRAERPLYPLRRTKDEDRDAPADDALVSLYDLSIPKTPSIGFTIASESEHIVGCLLRHQLNVLQQRAPRRLYLTWADRALFVWLYRGFPRILDANDFKA